MPDESIMDHLPPGRDVSHETNPPPGEFDFVAGDAQPPTLIAGLGSIATKIAARRAAAKAERAALKQGIKQADFPRFYEPTPPKLPTVAGAGAADAADAAPGRPRAPAPPRATPPGPVEPTPPPAPAPGSPMPGGQGVPRAARVGSLPDDPPPASAPAAPGGGLSGADPTQSLLVRPDVARAQALAQQPVAADYGDIAPDKSYLPNFNTINTTDDIHKLIAGEAGWNPVKVEAARRGVVRDKQLLALATDMGIDVDQVATVMQRMVGEGVPSPEDVIRARMMLEATAQELHRLGALVRSGTYTPQDEILFRRQRQFFSDFYSQFMGARAEAGRTLRAFGIPLEGLDGLDGAALRELNDQIALFDRGDIIEFAQQLEHMDTLSGSAKLASTYGKSKFEAVVQELFVGSILSGVKTFLVNIWGNATFLRAQVTERRAAAMMGSARSAMHALRKGKYLTADERALKLEADAMNFGMFSNFVETMKLVAKSFRHGESPDVIEKFSRPYHRAISAEFLEISGPMGRLVDWAGTFIRLPMERGMVPMDTLAKEMAFRADLARQAYRAAAIELEGKAFTPAIFASKVQHFIENAPPQAIDQAKAAGLYATFQTPLGKRGKQFQRLVNDTPFAFILAPFIQTPTNIFKAAHFERSPLAVAALFKKDSALRSAVRAGGAERDLALARLAMGTMTVGAVYHLVKSGTLTGGGPSNYKARQLKESTTGFQPYSFKVWNPITDETTWHSYARTEPFAFILGAVADAVEMIDSMGMDDIDTEDWEKSRNVVAALIGGIANNTMSKTFLRGPADFFAMASDPLRYGVRYFNNLGGALIPASSFRRDMGRMMDGQMREAFTWSEQLRINSGIPGYSEDAPLKLDEFGEPRDALTGTFLGHLSIMPDRVVITDDRVKLEVNRVMEATHRLPIGMPSKYVRGMRLTSAEYSQLVRLSRKDVTGVSAGGGKRYRGNFKDALRATIDSTSYLLATPDLQADMLRKVQRAYDNQARVDLYNINPRFQRRIDRWNAAHYAQKYGDEAALNLPGGLQ